MSDQLFEAANAGKAFFDNGSYIATVTNLSPAEGGNEEYGPSIQWKFNLAPAEFNDPEAVVLQEDGETPAELWQFSSTKMSPKAKGRVWAEAFIGRGLAEGEVLSKSMLIGQRAVILLAEVTNKAGKKVSSIASIKPYDPDEVQRKPNVRVRAAAQEPKDRADAELPF